MNYAFYLECSPKTGITGDGFLVDVFLLEQTTH